MATRMQQRRGTAEEWTTANPVLAAGEIGYETDTAQFKFGDGTNAWADLEYFSTSLNLDNVYLTDAEKGVADGVATLDVNGFIPIDQLGNIINGAPEILDTLNEVASAILDADGIVTAKIATALEDERVIYGAQISEVAGSVVSTQDYAEALSNSVDVEVARIDSSLQTLSTGLADQVLLHSNDMDSTALAIQANSDAISTLQLDVAPIPGIEESISGLTGDVQANAVAISSETADRIAAIILEQQERQALIDAETADRIAGDSDVLAAAALDAETKADAAQAAAEGYADTKIGDHNLVTTNVHGISDTSVLATMTDVSNAQAAAEGYADNLAVNYDPAGSATTAQQSAQGYTDSEISTHAAVTTSVHGIADTSDLALLSANTQTFSGDMVISGSLTVEGTTTTVSTENVVVSDPMIYIGDDNQTNSVDLGIVSSFNDGTYQHSGIVRDASDNKWKLFKGVIDEPTTTINFAQGSLDDLAVNNVEVASVVFPDGTSQSVAGFPRIREISQKTAAYTFVAGDLSTLVEISTTSGTAAQPVLFTIPSDSTYNFPVGATIDVLATNTGRVGITGEQGVTVNATPGLLLREQWSSATLLKRGANSWIAYGDLSAI